VKRHCLGHFCFNITLAFEICIVLLKQLSLYLKLKRMHISLQLKAEREKLTRRQNKALILGVWCFKAYMILFATLCALTIKTETPKVVVANSVLINH
jgi:hypothetical protein